MNIHLENIKLLLQDESLPEDKKQLLLKAVTKAVKKWAITDFKLDSTEKARRTTAILLEETIEELEQERSAVESQNRQLEIEAALERTRIQSMRMQHSKELDDTLRVFHEQVLLLGINSSFSFLWLPDEEKDRHIFWAAWVEDLSTGEFTKNNSTLFGSKAINYALDRNEPATAQCLIDWKGSEPVVSYHVPPAGVESYFAAWQELIAGVGQLKPEYYSNGLHYVEAFMKYGCFGVMIENEMPEEKKKILSRFAIEFERAYTRFLDLKKAEAQVREAQTETALERIRSRSLAMHKSDELTEVVAVVFKKLLEMDFSIDGAAFIITFIEGSSDLNIWLADNNQLYPTCFRLPYNEAPPVKDLWIAKESGVDCFSKTYSFVEKNHLFKYAFEHTDFKNLAAELKSWIIEQEVLNQTAALGKNSIIGIHFHYQKLLSENEVEILKRFSKVFDQAYVRFLDLQKAEGQAREAQIEAALESVRNRSMSMQKSEELANVSLVINEQLRLLNPIDFENAGILLDYHESDDFTFWIARPNQLFLNKQTIPYIDHPIFNKFIEAKKKELDFHTQTLTFEEKNKWVDHAIQYYTELTQEIIKLAYRRAGYTVARVFLKNVGVGMFVENYSGIPFSEDSNTLIRRFAKVFEQAYTRFLDLQKAEAHAREAQIELALERVRAGTMAMQKSEELSQVVFEFFEQINPFGLAKWGCGIMIVDEVGKGINLWLSTPSNRVLPSCYYIPKFDHIAFDRIWSTWKEQIPYEIIELSGNHKRSWDLHFLEKTDFKNLPDAVKEEILAADYVRFSFASMRYGLIEAIDIDPIPEEQISILQRFAKVFDQTYTRFLDLQKAEAQTREARIEATLEKIRSRSLGMHHSVEIKDVVSILFEKLKELDLVFDGGAAIHLFPEGSRNAIIWVASPDLSEPSCVNLPYDENAFENNPIIKDVWNAKETGKHIYNKFYTFEEKNIYFDYVFRHNDFITIPEPAREFILRADGYTASFIAEKNSLLGANSWTRQLFSVNDFEVLKRIARVFEQAYIRFLDLQKAEGQAREAKIEAALERTRTQSMIMQRSRELDDTLRVFHEQILLLGINSAFSFLWLPDEEKGQHIFWAAWGEDKNGSTLFKSKAINYPLDRNEPITAQCLVDWKSNETVYSYHVPPGAVKNYFAVWQELIGGVERLKPEYFSGGLHYVEAFMKYGCFGIMVEADLAKDEKKILGRFAIELERTYTRFLDLQKAEAQALEAIKRASVDRVRAEIASMRTTNDLERIQPLIWNELTTLGVPFIRCGVFIMDEEKQEVQTLLSTPEGKAIATLHVPFEFDLSIITNGVQYWRKRERYTEHWDAAAFTKAWLKLSLLRESSIDSQQSEHSPENLYLHMLPFLQGMLYVGSNAPLNEGQLQLVQNLADAFSTAYARYEDFNKLEAANIKIERTLVDLKQAQAQLVQSEKMASLGELTAGIAHEIQNPLNFVNNFSEVSNELIDEMNDEIEKGDMEEAKAIATGIKQNLEKILHHGKRADGIVKGMLQHSRSSSAYKEPTDINKLADEYLRLAYHGLRAKDNSFNATMKTDFDESIDNVNIIPQDIGRVLLNLYNNAFYAVGEKKKQQAENYEPTVSIKTKKLNGKIEVSVIDNGNGISQKVIDKIFQPFFTTKPTGQGTGLGLSLSYDIAKAHGGEIKVNTKEDEFTEFVIQLPISV